MSWIDRFGRAVKTIVDTAWMALVHPRTAILTRPVTLTLQGANTLDCGPCVAVMVEQLLKGSSATLADARVALLGSYSGGQTSVPAMVDWFTIRGLNAAYIPVNPKGLVETMRKALNGGAYCIPLVRFRYQRTNGHFILVYGVKDDGTIYAADPAFGFDSWSMRAFEDDTAMPCDRFDKLTPVIIVRRS